MPNQIEMRPVRRMNRSRIKRYQLDLNAAVMQLGALVPASERQLLGVRGFSDMCWEHVEKVPEHIAVRAIMVEPSSDTAIGAGEVMRCGAGRWFTGHTELTYWHRRNLPIAPQELGVQAIRGLVSLALQTYPTPDSFEVKVAADDYAGELICMAASFQPAGQDANFQMNRLVLPLSNVAH